MNEEIKTGFLLVSGGIYLFLSFLMACLALGFLLSFPDDMWWLGLAFGFSGSLFFVSGINSFKKHKRKEKENAALIKSMAGNSNPDKEELNERKLPSASEASSDILAC